MTGQNIAIAGAGIGGLAAAAFLAREGHRITVFDQFEAPAPVGSGLMLQETGLTILDRLNLRQDMERLGAPISRLYGLSQPAGRTVLDVRYGALRESLSGLAVQRSALFDLLLASAQHTGVQVTPNTTITAVNGHMGLLVDSDGNSHGRYDLILDGLGAGSPLIARPAPYLPFGALWATLPWPEYGFAADALEQRYFEASQMAGVMPSGRAHETAPQMATYFWSMRLSDYDDWRAAPLAHWKDQARRLWPETAPLLDHINHHDDLTFAAYRHKTSWPVARGCVVHIGDSWHAASPQLGQGANNALLDAYAIGAAVRHHPHDMAAAISAYATMRAMHVRMFQLMSFLFTPVYQSDSRVLPWLRDRLVAPLSKIWPGPQILAAMVSGAVGRPLARMGLRAGDAGGSVSAGTPHSKSLIDQPEPDV